MHRRALPTSRWISTARPSGREPRRGRNHVVLRCDPAFSGILQEVGDSVFNDGGAEDSCSSKFCKDGAWDFGQPVPRELDGTQGIRCTAVETFATHDGASPTGSIGGASGPGQLAISGLNLKQPDGFSPVHGPVKDRVTISGDVCDDSRDGFPINFHGDSPSGEP